MPLIESSTWWIVPAFALALFMVYAMMEFTVSLLVKPPRAGRTPVDADELHRRLLALNETGKPYRLVEGKVSDLELEWDVVDESWDQQFAKVKLSTVYRARMLLDEARHEVRWYEAIQTSNFFLGFDGWMPRFNFHFKFQSGFVNTVWSGVAYGILPGSPPQIGRVSDFRLDTIRVKKEISAVVNHGGWAFRPTTLWFQTRRGSYLLSEALLPAALREVPPRMFWGIVYPASYFVTIGFLLALTGAVDSRSLFIAAGISAIWWGIWGLLAWALTGFPAFWRRSAGSR